MFDLVAPVDDGTAPPFLDPLSYLKAILGGRCSGIPDCCIQHFLATQLPVEREITPEELEGWDSPRCRACRAAGRALVMRECPKPCACSAAVDAVASLLTQRAPGCAP